MRIDAMRLDAIRCGSMRCDAIGCDGDNDSDGDGDSDGELLQPWVWSDELKPLATHAQGRQPRALAVDHSKTTRAQAQAQRAGRAAMA